jgi:hypothetical protein
MEAWETLTMSRKEVPRAGLLKAALARKISNAQGALALHLSVRQFQRLKRRYAAEGAPGLRHRLRGRPSPRRRSESRWLHSRDVICQTRTPAASGAAASRPKSRCHS